MTTARNDRSAADSAVYTRDHTHAAYDTNVMTSPEYFR